MPEAGPQETTDAEPMIVEAVSRAVGALAATPRDRAALTDQLIIDLGYDSLRLVELSFLLEEVFSLDPVVMTDVPPMGTVADLVTFAGNLVADGLGTVPDGDAVDRALAAF